MAAKGQIHAVVHRVSFESFWNFLLKKAGGFVIKDE